MYPILGRYGPFFLYSFSVTLGIGLLTCIGLVKWQSARSGTANWFEALLVSLSAGVIGGRLGFAISHWEYFSTKTSEVWQIWQGGLSYHASLAAGVIALWGWCRWKQEGFALYADLFAPSLALGSAFGWLACWLEGCAYGRETTYHLLSADLPDEFGLFALRYQTQVIGIILSLLMFAVVMRLRQRWAPGPLFWLALLGLSSGRVIIGLMRADPGPLAGETRIDVVLDVVITLISLVLLQYKLRKRERPAMKH